MEKYLKVLFILILTFNLIYFYTKDNNNNNNDDNNDKIYNVVLN